MIFRVNKTSNYTVMSNYHLRDKRLSFKAKGLLSWMLSLPEDWDYSIAGIVSSNKEGEDAVVSGLNELKKYKYLVVEKLMPESDGDKVIRSRIEYVYNVYEIPNDNQDTEIQDTDFQSLEFQAIENPRQINTNKTNTKKERNVMDKPLHPATPGVKKKISKKRESLTDDLGGLSDVEEKKVKKKNLYEKCKDEVYNEKYNFSDEVIEALISYLPFVTDRSSNKCVKGINMWVGKLNVLVGLSKDPDTQLKIIMQSINNGSFGFYPLNNRPNKYDRRDPDIISTPPMTKEEKEAEIARRKKRWEEKYGK